MSLASHPRFTFSKEERLSSRKLIDELFAKGASFYFHPFRIHYLLRTPGKKGPPQMLVSVPARNFPRAVDRNRIRRIVRECYRLNKSLLPSYQESSGKQLLIAIVYSGKKIESYHTLRICVINILKRLADVAARKNS